MQKLGLKQNTLEWFAFRRLHIGASDAPSICGVNPYKNAYRLWKEKALGEVQPETNAMRRGRELESAARKEAEDWFGIPMLPECGLHESIKYMMASFDGYNEQEKCILEIKCPGEAVFDRVEAGNIPPSYIYQIQHQLEVAGFDDAYLFVFDGAKGFAKEIKRDQSIIDEILEMEAEFWNRIVYLDPPEDTHVERDDEAWKKAAEEFLLARDQYEMSEGAMKNAREKLIALASDQSSRGAGVAATRYLSRGAIDYKAIPELTGVDLNSFRKSPKESWRIA